MDTQAVSGRSRSQICVTPPPPKTSSQWVANSTARSPAWGSRGRDHPCRPQQSGNAARRRWPWSWILKDEEKCSRNQREEKFPKKRQCEKSTEKCFRRMTVPVAENILCDTTLPSQPNLPAPWHRTLAASNSDYPLCLHVPPPFTWQAFPSPLLPGEVFPGLPEFCQIPPAMCSHSLPPRPDAISLDSEHPEFFLFI